MKARKLPAVTARSPRQVLEQAISRCRVLKWWINFSWPFWYLISIIFFFFATDVVFPLSLAVFCWNDFTPARNCNGDRTLWTLLSLNGKLC